MSVNSLPLLLTCLSSESPQCYIQSFNHAVCCLMCMHSTAFQFTVLSLFWRKGRERNWPQWKIFHLRIYGMTLDMMCWIGPTNCQPKWLRTRSADIVWRKILWLLILSCWKIKCEWAVYMLFLYRAHQKESNPLGKIPTIPEISNFS